MKNSFLLLVLLIFVGCKNRQVQKSDVSRETLQVQAIRDTVWKEKIVEKIVVKKDTVIKKVYDFGIQGKPTYDSITKTWKPFNFDYWIYNGKDSIRHKGSFSGEGSLTSGINWEQRYKELLEKTKEQDKETKGTSRISVDSEKFREAMKNVQAEGWPMELAIYILSGTALVFYLLGLFTPKIKHLITNYLKMYLPFNK